MGELLAIMTQGLHGTPIPETRITEWEFGHRPIPDKVFTAAADILLDQWSVDRHLAAPGRRSEVDMYFSSALNRPLGELFRLEAELRRSRSVKLRHLARQVRKVRIAQMRYLESMLNVKMAYVFDDDFQPERDLEQVA